MIAVRVSEQKKDSNLLAGYKMNFEEIAEFLLVDFQRAAIQEKTWKVSLRISDRIEHSYQ